MKIRNVEIKKTKIIATMGPSFENDSTVKKMFKNGVNVVRLNTSHGNYEEHGARIATVKKIREELDLPITILLDTKGPEIRIGEIENNKMNIKIGDKIKIYSGVKPFVGKDHKIWITYERLLESVEIDQWIMVDDGKLGLQVVAVDHQENYVLAVAKNKHTIKTKKAINIPGVDLKLPFISEYDKNFIIWGIKQGVNIIAASFVSNAGDIKQLRELLDQNGGKDVKIMAKIEALQAINHINEIVKESDAIMLARGDLGVEIPYYVVPFYEKLLISKTRAWGKPVVIATQMLDSMIDSPRATRAEVTDVYYAAISGTDSTMLSGESASGNFPIESVETMSRILEEAEKNFNYLYAFEEAYAYVATENAESAYMVAKTALSENSKYIFAFSTKGRLINALSRFRPNAIIIALIEDEKLINHYGYYYGVYAQHEPDQSKYHDFEAIKQLAKEMGIRKGNKIIIANAKEFKTVKI